MEESDKSSHAEHLQAVHLQALSLVEHLQALTAEETPERLPLLLELIVQVQEVVKFGSGSADPASVDEKNPPLTLKQLQDFGKLLRDKRNAAGLSRIQLARRTKLSESGRRAPLPTPSPLRTGRASFPASGSSLSKAP